MAQVWNFGGIEGSAGDLAGAVSTTQGLLDEFGPTRVIDTPITEYGFAGIGTGAAMGVFSYSVAGPSRRVLESFSASIWSRIHAASSHWAPRGRNQESP